MQFIKIFNQMNLFVNTAPWYKK